MSGVTASFFICTDDFGSSVAGSSVGTALQTLLPEFFCTTTYVRPPQQNTRPMRYTTDCRTITNMPPAPGSPMVRGSLGSFGCAVDWMCATGSSSYLVPANSLPSSHS